MSDSDAWTTTRPLAVLGSGWAVPGDPVTSEALISTMSDRFGFADTRQARALGRRLSVDTRHFGRAFADAIESPRLGQSNPELAVAALAEALAEAGLRPRDLGYLVAHTATPAQALPANVATVADILGYAGPCVELRQACTGFGNALMIAAGLI